MRGLSTRPLRAAAIALGLAALFAVAARAHHYRLESTTTPAPFLRDGRADLVIEPSGVAPLGDGRRVLVAHEKAAPLHVVDVATGAIVGEPLGSPKFPPTTRTGPNWRASPATPRRTTTWSARTAARATRSGRPAACWSGSASGSARLPPSTTRRSSAGTSPRARGRAAGGGARYGPGRGTEDRGAGGPRGRRPTRAGHRPPQAGRQGPRLRRRHHPRARARRRARAPPSVRVRRRPPRRCRRAAHLAGVRPRDGRVPRPHLDGGRRQGVPWQHPLARRQQRDAAGARTRRSMWG